ncbi:HdeD family acid-resistance protein [Nocardia concava]|uniref:HdeD family acid-resistance protein n=1 Tax=Nocardia concava TaxID=257281 RepID=UPI0002F8FE26|nr:HdeD family acid-resistance protein [Nocardia concava]
MVSTSATGQPLPTPWRQVTQNTWQALLLTGILTALLGILILAWPGPTLVVAGILFGIYLLLAGLTQLMTVFGAHVSAGLRVLAFVSGFLSIMLGFFAFRSALESVLLLALWIGIGWLFRGIMQLIAALSDPDLPMRAWQTLSGLLITAAGIVLIVSPFDSITILTLLAGWWLIVIGILESGTAFQLRRATA